MTKHYWDLNLRTIYRGKELSVVQLNWTGLQLASYDHFRDRFCEEPHFISAMTILHTLQTGVLIRTNVINLDNNWPPEYPHWLQSLIDVLVLSTQRKASILPGKLLHVGYGLYSHHSTLKQICISASVPPNINWLLSLHVCACYYSRYTFNICFYKFVQVVCQTHVLINGWLDTTEIWLFENNL